MTISYQRGQHVALWDHRRDRWCAGQIVGTYPVEEGKPQRAMVLAPGWSAIISLTPDWIRPIYVLRRPVAVAA